MERGRSILPSCSIHLYDVLSVELPNSFSASDLPLTLESCEKLMATKELSG